MGYGCTPAELVQVTRMVRERIGPDWLILALPDGRYAALWRQGLECEHGAGVARGDYSGCYVVGTLAAVRAAIHADIEADSESVFFDHEGRPSI